MSIFKKSAKKTAKNIIPKESDSVLAGLPITASSHMTDEEGELALDVFQTKNEVVVIAPVAGVKKNDLKVQIDDDVLQIQGKREFSFEVDQKDYVHQECYWGSFSRSIVLPDTADIKHVKATMKDGIVVVRIPKVEKVRNKVVDIKEE